MESQNWSTEHRSVNKQIIAIMRHCSKGFKISVEKMVYGLRTLQVTTIKHETNFLLTQMRSKRRTLKNICYVWNCNFTSLKFEPNM